MQTGKDGAADYRETNKRVVSKVEVDRQQWEPVGGIVGSEADPIISPEVAESKKGAGDVILKKLSRKSQHKPLCMFEQSEAASVSKMEGDVEVEVEAIVGRNAESVRELEVEESKGGTGDGTLKQLSRKSQKKVEVKASEIGKHVLICKKGRLSCCNWCPHDHKEHCEVGREEVARTGQMKASRVTVEGVVEAVRNVKDFDARTRSKRKNRACEPERYEGDPSDVCDAENCQKGKSVLGSRSLSEKEEKILKVAEVCGAELPHPDRSMNYSGGSFSSCGISWCREQYNTNKALLDAVSTVVVGMKVSDFVKEAVKRIPAAELEFGELYAEQQIEMKAGRAVVRSYKAAPKKVRKLHLYIHQEQKKCWSVKPGRVNSLKPRPG